MTENQEKLEQLFNTLHEKLSGDENVELAVDELHLESLVPYGIPVLPCLDIALGRPGIPVGRIIEFFGWEGCGKTSLALRSVASCQSMGGAALWIDAENAFPTKRARQLGVDTDPPNLIVAKCDTIESIVRTQETTVKQLAEINYTKPFMTVTDSITAVSTEKELEKDFNPEQRVGHEAKQIRAGLKRLANKLGSCMVPAIFINHNIGTPPKGNSPYAPTSASAGGHALKFWSSVRVEITRIKDYHKQEKGEKIRTGQQVVMRVRKNRMGELARETFEVNLMNDIGFDVVDNLLDAYKMAGFITKPPTAKDSAAGTIYTMVVGEEKLQFKRSEWPELVDAELGGLDVAWKNLIETATEDGIICPYGGVVNDVQEE